MIALDCFDARASEAERLPMESTEQFEHEATWTATEKKAARTAFDKGFDRIGIEPRCERDGGWP